MSLVDLGNGYHVSEIVVATPDNRTGTFRVSPTNKTLMGWIPEFDEKGRPLNADPNWEVTSYQHVESGEWFTQIRKGWVTRYFEGLREIFAFDSGGHFHEIDETPDYVRER